MSTLTTEEKLSFLKEATMTDSGLVQAICDALELDLQREFNIAFAEELLKQEEPSLTDEEVKKFVLENLRDNPVDVLIIYQLLKIAERI